MTAFPPRPGQRLRSNLAEINVTPLVDVMLVLLIIFMVTTPMMQSGIAVNLPSAESKTHPSTGGVVLTVARDRRVYLDGRIINVFLLETRLRDLFAGRAKKVVFLKADRDVSYGTVIEVMDIAKRAGIETVGMIVEPKIRP